MGLEERNHATKVTITRRVLYFKCPASDIFEPYPDGTDEATGIVDQLSWLDLQRRVSYRDLGKLIHGIRCFSPSKIVFLPFSSLDFTLPVVWV